MTKNIQEFLDKVPDYVKIIHASQELHPTPDEPDFALPKRAVVVLAVGRSGWGFGEITIIAEDGQIFIDAEMSGRETVKEFLNTLVAEAILDSDIHPDEHKLYNRVHGRQCSERCQICYPKEE